MVFGYIIMITYFFTARNLFGKKTHFFKDAEGGFLRCFFRFVNGLSNA